MNTETRPDAKSSLRTIALAPLPRRSGFRMLRHMMYAVLYCALIIWVGVMTGLVVISGFLGLALALVCTVVYVIASRRSAQQDALLWALAVTAERGMPMTATFDAFAGQCGGKYQRKCAAADRLRQGLSLPEVLACEPGLFPRDAQALIRVGHDCGTLGPALREAAALPARLREPWTGVAIRVSYLLWVVVVFQVMGGFMNYFILPKFEAIFNDFGVALPAVTTLSIELSHQFVRYFYLLFPLFLLQLGLLGLATISTFGVLPWDLPIVGRLFYGRHTALVLRCLAQVMDAQKPTEQGIRTLERTFPVEAIRFRLRRVAHDIEQGRDWCGALLARGLISPSEASLLEAAKRVGNLSWALRQAAETSERRLIYRLQIGTQWLVPVFVLAAGTLVFLMAVAYFTPLLVLIEKLAS